MTAALFAWGLEGLIASTLLIVATLALRRPVRRWFGPRVAYALWALPAVRLLLPPVSLFWPRHAPMPISAAGQAVVVAIRVDAPAASGLSPALVAAIWAIGALALLGYHIARYRRFRQAIWSEATAVERLDGVTVLTSGAAAGPLAFGIRRRCVALPLDFAERYDAEERALALAHEVGHHRRGDIRANWAALVVLACHWFDPLAWTAFRAFRTDQELANDAAVTAGRPPSERHAYARAIVKAAGAPGIAAACHFHGIKDLKGRLLMLTSHASRRRLAAGTATVVALAVGGLGLTASGSGAAIIRQEAAAALPAPAATPAPVPTGH